MERGVSGMGGNDIQRKIDGRRAVKGGGGGWVMEKSLWASHRAKMTRGGGVGGRERGQFIFQPDILGTRTHGYGPLHLRWKQL